MKLNVNELKRFKANSASIKTNSILPILSYLKFDKGTVTKNSMGSFVTQKIDCDKSFLVDEKILMSLVECTSSPTISIDVKDGRIIMSDGSTKKTSPSEPVENFPSNSEPDSEPITIDREVLESIGIASQFVIDLEVPAPSCFVFVGKKHVCGSNGAIAYIDEFEDELPEMVLDRATAQTIFKYENAKYSSNESYIFFETDDLKFGFIKPSHKWFDETPFGTFESGVKFIMDKSEFVNINDMVIKDTISKIAQASIEVTDGKMFFEMNDTGYEVNTTREFLVEGDNCDKFNFNPVLMNKLLKSVPDTELTFNKVGNRYYITGDSGFVALIIGMG